MKNLIALTTLAALTLCLHAEEDKTLIPGRPLLNSDENLGPVTQEEVKQLRQRAIELSKKGERNRKALEELHAAIESASDQQKLQRRDPAYAEVEAKDIDDILNNPYKHPIAKDSDVISLPITEKEAKALVVVDAEGKNDGGIPYEDAAEPRVLTEEEIQKYRDESVSCHGEQPSRLTPEELADRLLSLEALSGAQSIISEETKDTQKNSQLAGEPTTRIEIHGEVGGLTVMDTGQPGWKALSKDDFTKVNSADDTWEWKEDMLCCTGKPVSVMRTVKEYKNFEMVVEWRHNKPAGNSGVFVWATPESIEKLTQAGKPGLPKGIEVQVLDNGYTDKVAKSGGKTDWFTTHGDVFPVGVKMTPIGKVCPNGVRSFPRQDLSKDHGNWNHYYIRAINGEVRLWVNGQEVSGGTNIEPAQGYLCLESEGSPIDFKNLHIRELP